MLEDRVRVRLDELSTRLGNADWLDGAFSAGDLLMVTVLRRLNGSGILEKYPNLLPMSPVAKHGPPISVLSLTSWRFSLRTVGTLNASSHALTVRPAGVSVPIHRRSSNPFCEIESNIAERAPLSQRDHLNIETTPQNAKTHIPRRNASFPDGGTFHRSAGAGECATRFLAVGQEIIAPRERRGSRRIDKGSAAHGEMIGDAKIVGLSEGQHAAAEPLIFRNRLFKHLVEQLGFKTIAIESGIVESRVLNDYVTQGKGEFDAVLGQGFSNGFDTFRQNGELIRWMRDYNARLPRGCGQGANLRSRCSGKPRQLRCRARTRHRPPIRTGIPPRGGPPGSGATAASGRGVSPVLKGINGYGELKEAERDALTAAIADLVSLMERQRFAYIERSSKDDFDWAERAAIGARQTDTWFRRMPAGWKLEDGLAWTRYAMQVRDRAMADNLEWVRSQTGFARARAGVCSRGTSRDDCRAGSCFAISRDGSARRIRQGTLRFRLHQHTQPLREWRNRLLLCEPAKADAAQAAARLGGRDSVCSRECSSIHTGSPARAAWRVILAAAGARSLEWIRPVQFATAELFDLVYYVSPLTPACAPPIQTKIQ